MNFAEQKREIMNYNENVINTQTRKSAREQHDGNPKWRNYAQRAQKNPFVQQYLMTKYNGICQYCGLPIRKNLNLQHKVYDRECVTDETIRVPHSTPKHPDGTRKVPDCEHCDNFHECIDGNLFPVHSKCNWQISLVVCHRRKAV